MKENKKSNESYFTVSRHKRRRNMMIIIPIVAVVMALTVGLAVVSGAGPLKGNNTNINNKPILTHVHPHLTITVDGKPMTVPGQIGMDAPLWKDHSLDQYGMQGMSDGMQGMAPLHTHDDSGTIHAESTTIRNYTLGQFLAIWGGLNLNGKSVKATVDGTTVPDYRNIVLRDGEQINLQVQ